MTDARLATTITAALDKCATSLDATARQRWAFTLSNGTELAARARVRDRWLAFDAPLGAACAAPDRLWELLAWNATLGGGVRFALGPGRRGTRARAELPLDDEVDLGRRIVETCAGLKAASDLLGGAEPSLQRAARNRGGDGLRELCRQSGWPVVERDAASSAVDLDVPDAFVQALVAPRADGSVSVATPLLTETQETEPAAVCRQAVGLLLLRVCGVVRMARGAIDQRLAGRPDARFEVVFESLPCAAELAHAFAALSVACRVASREAAVLWSSERVATAYVEQWEQDKEENHGTGSSSEDGRAAGE